MGGGWRWVESWVKDRTASALCHSNSQVSSSCSEMIIKLQTRNNNISWATFSDPYKNL